MNKTELTDGVVGKFAVLTRGYYSGLIGKIEKNAGEFYKSPYIHVTKTGGKSGIRYEEDIKVVENIDDFSIPTKKYPF